MANVSEIKRGQVIRWKDDLWIISSFQHVSPGKGSAFTRIKLKGLTSGKSVENTFKSTETLDFVDVQRKDMQFLFADDHGVTCMDMVSFEQVVIDNDVIGDDRKYLKDGLRVSVSMYEGCAVTMELPKKIEYTVAETQPAVKGDTASGNVSKDAIMDNGLLVRVPIFVKQGEHVLVNTDTGEYCERVS